MSHAETPAATLTLADFLLARIAEDEREGRDPIPDVRGLLVSGPTRYADHPDYNEDWRP